MNNRHKKLGIKQTIQKHWMDYVVKMMLAGLSEKEIRSELDKYLATQKQSGGTGKRGQKTYGMAIGILASWYSPDEELIKFRDYAFKLIQNTDIDMWLPFHWAIISASYPFWFNVAKQVGRLFNLQDQVTQSQIFTRMKEQFGDRETVTRNARYTIRSFIAWDVLHDAKQKGCYKKRQTLSITEPEIAMLLYTASLYTVPEHKSNLSLIQNNPAFYPFKLPVLTGDYITRNSCFIDVFRNGFNDDLLILKPI